MKKVIKNMDIWLLVLMILFSSFGLLMIFSASSIAAVLKNNTTSSYYFIKQLVSVIIAFGVGVVIVNIPTNWYKPFFARLAVYGIIVALIFVLSYGIISNGAQSWYDFGKFDFQPAELAKSILIIYFGVYYNKLLKSNHQNYLNLIKPIVFSVVIAVLVFMQPDFGGAVIIASLAFFIFLSVPMSQKLKKNIILFLVTVVGVGLVTALLFGKNIFNENQMQRFVFLNPCSRYQQNTGYQVCNSYIAINNGGLLGVGLGDSTQKYLYLPEAHTDFIFPIIVEELGLLVGIAVLLGYIFLLSRILIIAKKANNIRNSTIAYGVFLLLISHILINLLGVLGLFPLTGVPLPFLSYGGSFNLFILALLFIVQRISIENKMNIDKKI